MDNEKNIEFDKAIAYFMGWRIDNSFPDKGRVWRSPKGDLELDTTFKFSSDWNKLMEVFEAVNALEYYESKISNDNCIVCGITGDDGVWYDLEAVGTKESTYKALATFIVDYNKSQIVKVE